jgi:ankyrin repeat protein
MFYIEEQEKMTQIEDRSDEFIEAAAKGEVETVKKLLENGMHPDTQGPKGWTALRMAAVGNRYEAAYVLLNHGANVDAVNYTGKTALMMACVYDHYEMVTLLLFFGADPNLANCGGRTALMIAVSYGYLRQAKRGLTSYCKPIQLKPSTGRST